ncbi:hypothetical protein X750_31270 [Mesorhizobium sp. LNJC394B00]|nr:hypothetical protein X750_31270 [Mesorhizobium sp. LNJC394B00]
MKAAARINVGLELTLDRAYRGEQSWVLKVGLTTGPESVEAPAKL